MREISYRVRGNNLVDLYYMSGAQFTWSNNQKILMLKIVRIFVPYNWINKQHVTSHHAFTSTSFFFFFHGPVLLEIIMETSGGNLLFFGL